jgi:FMN reductase
MSLLRVVGFSGNTRRPSRSRTLVDVVSAELGRQHRVERRTFDLLDAGPGLGAAFTRDELTPEALAVIEAIEEADALIVGTPVYKGSYTGLFKHLFDFVDPGALAEKPIVLTATGGGQRHALVVEHQLRPLFGFFAAQTMPTAIYAADQEFIDGALANPFTIERAIAAATQLGRALSIQEKGLRSGRAA